MISRLLLACVLSILSAQAWGAPEDCALTDEDGNGFIDHLDANLNELKSKGGGGPAGNSNLDFVEFKVLKANVDIDGWELCFSSDPKRESCENIGDGKATWYTVAQTGGAPDDEGPDPLNPTVFQAETWIVLDTNNLKAEEGEVILFNDRNEVVDYIRYSNKSGICSDSNKRWDVDETVCGTCVDSRDPSQKDFARLDPDGTGDWTDNDSVATEGASNEPPPAPSLGSFQINVGASASTCVAQAITITALDGSGTPLAGYAGTIDLSTSTSNGDWSTNAGSPATNPVVPTPDNNDDGAASYTFDAAGDGGTVVLNLSNSHAETLQITVSDTTAGISSTSIDLSFGDNAFVISNTEFAHPLAGRDHAFTVSFYQRDTSQVPANCAIATGYDGLRSLKGWYTPNGLHPAGAADPALVDTATSTVYAISSTEPTPADPTNLDLSFVAGVAAFTLRTTDVGQYILNLKDDTGSFADPDVTGASAPFTVRPVGIKVEVAGNPGGTTPDGALFAAAGDLFGVTLTAVRWQGEAIDANGNPTNLADVNDNTLTTPGFAADLALLAGINTPAAGIGGTDGVLDLSSGATQVAAADITNGVASPNDLRYSEVGSMQFTVTATDYLGSGINVSGISPIVGRFKPHHFHFSLAPGPTWQAGCTAFTYLDQALTYGTAPSITLSAHNAQHGITSNYSDFGGVDDWWRVDNPDLSVTFDDPGMPAGITLAYTGTGNPFTDIDTPTGAGQVLFTLKDDLTYQRPVPASHAAGLGYTNFDAAPAITLSLTSIDGDDDADLMISPDEVIMARQIRHGRLKMNNANGSELLDLSLPLLLEYFNGTTWTSVVDDVCTALAITDFSYSPATSADAVTAFGAVVPGVGGLDYNCSVAVPCAVGAIDVTADLADAAGTGTPPQPWLMYDWTGDGTDDEPRARASFGTFQGNQRHIYQREIY